MTLLSDISYNVKERLYQVKENGIMYLFPFEQIADLHRRAMGVPPRIYLADWYKSLDKTERFQVKRVGVEDDNSSYRYEPLD